MRPGPGPDPREMKHRFHHFHDFYSKTYPRFESYTSKEREVDLYTMMKTISENDNRKLVQEIYYTPQGDLNPIFKQNVLSAVGDAISAELSGPFVQEVIMILSGPDARVALSGNVTQIVTGSEVIKANTISVIGEAISTDVLREQMEIGVGNVISSDALSDQMFEATEKVLANDEISSALVEPVSHVVPTDEVGEAVAEEAAKRITIEKIIGDKNLRFVDKDGDGVDDNDGQSYQSDPTATLIWGGLGA